MTFLCFYRYHDGMSFWSVLFLRKSSVGSGVCGISDNELCFPSRTGLSIRLDVHSIFMNAIWLQLSVCTRSLEGYQK